VLDSTTAGDRAGVEGGRCVARFGQGPVISFMDKGTSYDKGLYNLGMDCARQLGVPAQTKTMVAGGNDSGAVHVSRGGVRTVSASMPCRYLHAPVCMIVKSDYEAMLGTVKLLAQRIAGGEG
jgi:endoglucanase